MHSLLLTSREERRPASLLLLGEENEVACVCCLSLSAREGPGRGRGIVEGSSPPSDEEEEGSSMGYSSREREGGVESGWDENGERMFIVRGFLSVRKGGDYGVKVGYKKF